MDAFDYYSRGIADKMLLVTDIKYRYVPNDVWRIEALQMGVPLGCQDFHEIARDIKQELVRGRRYCNSNGDEVCIGLPIKFQDILGLPFDEFDRLKDDIELYKNNIQVLRKEKREAVNELRSYKEMSFWQRLKFLFKGGK